MLIAILTVTLPFFIIGCTNINEIAEYDADFILDDKVIGLFLSEHGYSSIEFVRVYYAISRNSEARVFITSTAAIEIVDLDTKEKIEFVSLNDINLDELDAFIVIGGKGVVMDVEIGHHLLLETIQGLNERETILGSVCGGSGLLARAEITNGRKIAGVGYMEEVIVNSGATFSSAAIEIDGNIFTAQLGAEASLVEQLLTTLQNR